MNNIETCLHYVTSVDLISGEAIGSDGQIIRWVQYNFNTQNGKYQVVAFLKDEDNEKKL